MENIHCKTVAKYYVHSGRQGMCGKPHNVRCVRQRVALIRQPGRRVRIGKRVRPHNFKVHLPVAYFLKQHPYLLNTPHPLKALLPDGAFMFKL